MQTNKWLTVAAEIWGFCLIRGVPREREGGRKGGREWVSESIRLHETIVMPVTNIWLALHRIFVSRAYLLSYLEWVIFTYSIMLLVHLCTNIGPIPNQVIITPTAKTSNSNTDMFQWISFWNNKNINKKIHFMIQHIAMKSDMRSDKSIYRFVSTNCIGLH